MDAFLQVNSSENTIPASPTCSSFTDEVTSICPLITPSPPTNDLINPLPDGGGNYTIGQQLATMLQHVHDDKCTGDSASSSSSALTEPVCTQLLNHRNAPYHHITKDEDAAAEETSGKVQTMQLTFRNPPDNYFFMSWNWPLIRKISLWLFLSGLVAMVALVIAMISSLPKTCNPPTEWYQGGVIYEVFPASFHDSNNDMIGDFKGLTQKSDYLKTLGVGGIRLNSIFKTVNYPEDYYNATTLFEIAPVLGNITSFDILVRALHSRNISLLLDLPIHPAVKYLGSGREHKENKTHLGPSAEFLRSSPISDQVEEALLYWSSHGVDGFYLKGLEHFAEDVNLPKALRRWKKTVGSNRPLIVNEALLELALPSGLNTILSNVDLVDHRLVIENGVGEVSKQIERIQNGTLFTTRGAPWIQWSLGDVTTNRLANILPFGNVTLGATLLQLMLPGTPSIFYGNEIGLQIISDPHGERKDLQHLHQLAPMAWPSKQKETLSWMHSERTHTDFEQAKMIRKMIELRAESPSVYVNSVFKEGDNRANAEVKYSRSELLVIQRWYPRRKSYVVASNLGESHISADLSTILYSGTVVIGPRSDSKPGSVSFKDISLWPGESVIILLD